MLPVSDVMFIVFAWLLGSVGVSISADQTKPACCGYHSVFACTDQSIGAVGLNPTP